MMQAAHGQRQGGMLPPLVLLLLGCLALALPAAGAGPASLTIGVGRDLLDGPDSRAYLHGSTNTWEALTYLGPDLAARPWLARSWQCQDGGRAWVFHLRSGVRFHDGSPLTAQEARASILRIASHPKYDPAGVYRDLVKLEARGPLELVFHLKEPRPDFPNLVAYFSSPILKPSLFGPGGRLTGFIATGPFMLGEARPGESITLEAFAGYWGSRPVYQRVVFRTILDAQTRAMALMAGQVDAVADVGAILPQQAAEIKAAPGMTLKQVEVATTHYLLFNCARPPFDQAPARRWLAGLLDRGQLVAAFAGGAGKVAQDPFSPLAKAWTFGNLRPGPGQAPAHPGRPLVILLHGGTLERWPYQDLAQVIQQLLAARGLACEITVREPGGYYEDLQQGRFDLALQPNTMMTGEPDFFYTYYLARSGPRSFGCGCEQTDRLIDQGRRAMDPVRRREIYQLLAAWVSDNLPLLPLYHDLSLYAHGPKVAGFVMDHNFRPLLSQARPVGRP